MNENIFYCTLHRLLRSENSRGQLGMRSSPGRHVEHGRSTQRGQLGTQSSQAVISPTSVNTIPSAVPATDGSSSIQAQALHIRHRACQNGRIGTSEHGPSDALRDWGAYNGSGEQSRHPHKLSLPVRCTHSPCPAPPSRGQCMLSARQHSVRYAP